MLYKQTVPCQFGQQMVLIHARFCVRCKWKLSCIIEKKETDLSIYMYVVVLATIPYTISYPSILIAILPYVIAFESFIC